MLQSSSRSRAFSVVIKSALAGRLRCAILALLFPFNSAARWRWRTGGKSLIFGFIFLLSVMRPAPRCYVFTTPPQVGVCDYG